MNVLALQALLACNMALLEVEKIAFSGTPGIIDNMRTHHLLAVQQNCSRCAVAMRERPRADVSDGASWWCPRCKTRKSIRSGSFFEKSHITLQKWLLLFHFWARYYYTALFIQHFIVVTCISRNAYHHVIQRRSPRRSSMRLHKL